MAGPDEMPDALKRRRMASYSSNVNSPSRPAAEKAPRKQSSTPGVYPFQVRDARAASTSVMTERKLLSSGRADRIACRADEFPLQQLDLGGQRHVAQASREPVHTGQELPREVGPRPGLLLDPLSEAGRHPASLLILCATLAVVVTGRIIPPRPRGINRRAPRPRSRVP